MYFALTMVPSILTIGSIESLEIHSKVKIWAIYFTISKNRNPNAIIDTSTYLTIFNVYLRLSTLLMGKSLFVCLFVCPKIFEFRPEIWQGGRSRRAEQHLAWHFYKIPTLD